VDEVRPIHIDDVLTRIVSAGAPTVANDVRRYLLRMFHFAVKRKWFASNPAYRFEVSDACGTEPAKSRWLDEGIGDPGSTDAEHGTLRPAERARGLAATHALRAEDGVAVSEGV
jgi:hypothetical protein